MKSFLTIAFASLLFLSATNACESKGDYTQKKEAAEQKGQDSILLARKYFEKKDYQTARNIVVNIRKENPLAINARNAGILLLDSINLFEAEAQFKEVNELLKDTANANRKDLQIEWDDLLQKTKFYKRKLEHDK